MKNIKKSIFLLLGVFVLCMFSQATFAQEKAEAKKQVKELKTLKKGDKIRSTNGKRTVLDRNAKPTQRPAIQRNNQTKPTQNPAARPNKVRPVPGKGNVKRPIPNKQVRPVEPKADSEASSKVSLLENALVRCPHKISKL